MDRGALASMTPPTATRPLSDLEPGPRTTAADPGAVHGVLLVVAAAAALVWALAGQDSSDDPRRQLEREPPPDAAKESRKRADYF